MKVFVSSLINGHEDLRDAAISAIRSLGHEIVRAEDFPATPASPQVACLGGVRASDAVVLILAERYGVKQASGISATHEEFRAAKDTRPVFAFVRSAAQGAREPEQDGFVREVQGWVDGLFTGSFTDPASLREAVTGALHRWEMSKARASVDPEEMLGRAKTLLPRQERGYSGQGLFVSVAVAGGPRQSIIRPARLEDPELAERLEQMALFGPTKIFVRQRGTKHRLKGDVLVVHQDEGASFSVDELGGVRVSLRLEHAVRGTPEALIEEDVSAAITSGLRFASAVLDTVDPTKALSQVVPAVTVTGASYHPWIRRVEAERRTGGMSSMRMSQDGPAPAHLQPPERSRAALTQELDGMVEDLVVLLRRAYRVER